MPLQHEPFQQILTHPGAFTLRVLKGFRANQGFLLAGAVAYYALLSLIPLMILVVMALSHWIDEASLLETLRHYVEFAAPGQSSALIEALRTFLADRQTLGTVLLVTLIFFSALAFSVLENAMSVIFFHRVMIRRRHPLVSAIIPYCFIVFLGVGFLIATMMSGALQAMSLQGIKIFGAWHSLSRLSAFLYYIVGVFGEILLLTSIYLVMPAGRLSFRHALLGGTTAGLLWELARHALVWYYASISQIGVVYGSLTTAIAVLLSVEVAALLLLLGAQVIAEYERLAREPLGVPPEPMPVD
jgi:YihY family inner membrane protein